MRRIRTLAILASLAIAIGGAGFARAETSTMKTSSQTAADPGSATVSCSVAKTTGHSVSASDTGSKGGPGGTITGYSIDWGDGTHTAQSASPPSGVTHTYTGNGPFAVNETIFGTP